MEHFAICFQMAMFWPFLPLNFKLRNIGHNEIIIVYYWNETFIIFIDSF